MLLLLYNLAHGLVETEAPALVREEIEEHDRELVFMRSALAAC